MAKQTSNNALTLTERIFSILNDRDPDLIAEIILEIEREDKEEENKQTRIWLEKLDE